MRFIAHRGNTLGKKPKRENDPIYILEALKQDFDAEIDLWIDDYLFLGHDKPEHKISDDFLYLHQEFLWIHCKNLKALKYSCNRGYNAFFHDKDDFTLTSKRFIWTYPGVMEYCSQSVVVMNEKKKVLPLDIYGICTDNVTFLKG